MIALLVLLLAVALIVLATRRPVPAPPPDGRGAPPRSVAEKVLQLPEPARARAWALLCGAEDALRADLPEERSAYLLRELRDAYLPDTVEAYLRLTPSARALLERQGQSAEAMLVEQIALMEDGYREVQRQDHAAADRLLTQGRFLRERFGSVNELRIEDR